MNQDFSCFSCIVFAKYNPSSVFIGDLPEKNNPHKILKNCSSVDSYETSKNLLSAKSNLREK